MLGGKNSKNKQPLGYTIIEVMIVLAVSGVMFLIAANFISGKQERASFTQGTNDMSSQIQDVIQQVSAGKFSDIPLNCTFNPNANGVGNGLTSINNGSTVGHGQNASCTFLGKLLAFPNPAATNTYRTISLAGGLVDGTAGSPTIQTPPTSGTIFVDPVAISGQNTLTTTQNVSQNLDVKSLTIDGSNTTARNFGFMEGLGSTDGNSFQDGAQTISLIYSPVSMANAGTADTAVNGNFTTAKSVVMCVTDSKRYAKVLIGGNAGDASQLSVDVQVVPTC